VRRALATLGVVGLALLSVSAPAYAEADFKLCHNGSELMIDLHGASGLGGHTNHPDDIIPPNELLPGGLNWPQGGDPDKPCAPVAVVPPVVVVDPPVVVVDPPVVVVDPPVTVVDPPVVSTEVPATVTPAAQTPAPQAATPQGAAATVPAAQAAAVSKGTNEGFNAQTAVGRTDEGTTWLAGLGVLLGAGAVVAVRRRSRTESPTAG
jgi:hypothetical protein